MTRPVAVARRRMGQPFIKNARMENIPQLTAATTANQTWIDGTAGGSLTNRTYGWGAPNITPSAAASFDATTTHFGHGSIKIETFDAAGTAAISVYRSTPSGFALPVEPGKSYTLRAWAKCQAATNQGVNIAPRTLTNSYATINTYTGNTIGGTTDWTLLTVTFTTEANAAYVVPLLRYAPGQAGVCWFDEIDLLPNFIVERLSAV